MKRKKTKFPARPSTWQDEILAGLYGCVAVKTSEDYADMRREHPKVRIVHEGIDIGADADRESRFEVIDIATLRFRCEPGVASLICRAFQASPSVIRKAVRYSGNIYG
jgi:hypothetical protein